MKLDVVTMLVGLGARLRFALAIVVGAATLASPLSSQASDVHVFDIVVRETIPVTHGTIIKGRLEGCATATVRTTRSGSSQGSATSFNGSKKFNCGSGNTLTLAFKVSVSGCSATNSGTWKVTRGTGIFAKAEGSGKLSGRYTLRKAPGTSCNADGIEDHFTGTIEY